MCLLRWLPHWGLFVAARVGTQQLETEIPRLGRIPSKASGPGAGCQEAVEWLAEGLSGVFEVERWGS